MVKHIQGDITKVKADVIVNAANTENVHGGGVDLAIARAAGQHYKNFSNEMKTTRLGEFLVSPAGNLQAKHIIDVPTIDLTQAKLITKEQLEKVWDDVLAYCKENNLRSIATPLLGAGFVGFKPKEIKTLLTDVANKYADLDVIIVEL